MKFILYCVKMVPDVRLSIKNNKNKYIRCLLKLYGIIRALARRCEITHVRTTLSLERRLNQRPAIQRVAIASLPERVLSIMTSAVVQAKR